MRMVKVLCILAGVALILSCSSPAGGANTTRVVTGTITVLSSGYWPNVKLGVFSGGALGTHTALDTTTDTFGNVNRYRVYYSSGSYSGADVAVPPLAGTTYSIPDQSGTSSSYSFELPATVPKYDGTNRENYYYAAWYDNGSIIGMLEVKDSSTPGTIELGEFNRCATKLSTDGNSVPMAILSFQQSQDNNGNPTGNYKYYGYDGASYNEYTELNNSSSGFNFAIDATAGW